MKRSLIITIHVAAWACFLLLPFALSWRARMPNMQFSIPFLWMLATINAYLIAFFYTNSGILIPRLLARRKWLWYALVVIVCLLIFIQIPRLFDDAIRAAWPAEIKEKFARRRKPSGGFMLFSGYTALFFLVFTISTCIKVIQQWLAAERNRIQIEKDKVTTELSYLKNQINPHFLFNTLNNIYSLALVKSDQTPGAIYKLSSIMRYVLNDTKHDWVPLQNEISFIEDYIELQKVRLTNKVDISFVIKGNASNKMIAPLILIPFVENAFKYGISTREFTTICIQLSISEKAINFLVKNKVVTAERGDQNNNGIGLKNARRRLELLYPQKHALQLTQPDLFYQVDLTLYQ